MFSEAKVTSVFWLKSCSLGVTDGLGHSLCHIQGPSGNGEEMSLPPASPFQSFIETGLPQEEAQDGIEHVDPQRNTAGPASGGLLDTPSFLGMPGHSDSRTWQLPRALTGLLSLESRVVAADLFP